MKLVAAMNWQKKLKNFKSKREYIKKLDRIFSKYIRLSRSVDDYVTCFTCGKILRIKEATVGHFIKRQYLGTRFDEVNCQIQCKKCNYFLQGNDVEFQKRLIDVYGIDVVNNLYIKSRQRIDVFLLYTYYKQKLEELSKII